MRMPGPRSFSAPAGLGIGHVAAIALAVQVALPVPPALAADPAAARSAPACRFADVVTERADYDDWASTIVDTELRLPHGYAPTDLVSVGRAGLAGSARVRNIVVDDLHAMANAARDDGAPLAAISAYRSEDDQRAVFADWVRMVGRDAARLASARPGHSEHQLGTTIDFTTPDLTGPWSNDFGHSPQGRWLHRQAASFGFIESYPAAWSPGATCYQPEPWHYRYVGRAEAAEVVAAQVPLRLFLFDRRGTAAPSERAGASTATPAATPSIRAEAPLTDASPVAAAIGAVGGTEGQSPAPVFLAGLAVGLAVDWLRAVVHRRRRKATPTWQPRGQGSPRRR